ncbi:hypothetical protein OF83DRAFT_192879 [Amylostereum chailletii]|nr:hypothetical protein OF83DRAFT_192879 [Amylostereum chailletii]
MSGKTALLLGATGQTGAYLLQELLNSPTYTRVLEAGRRVTPADKLPASAKDKLEQRVIDFEKLDEAKLGEGFDVVYVTLGTTAKQAGSSAMFEKIDREYVVNAARAAKSSETTRSQRLVYLCSQAPNPKSMILYSRSKGLTEQALAELGYSDTIIFRPGFLANTSRPASDSRPLESMAGPIVSLVSRFTSSVAINIDTLAKSMRIAGTLGSGALPAAAAAYKANWGGKEFTVVGNNGAIQLAKEDH